MKDINKLILIGRVGADPILRETKSGKKVIHFSVATGRRIKKEGDLEFKEETQWHSIVGWGKLAENCALYLKKGQAVYVEGRVKTSKYDDDQGISKLSYEVVASEVNFLQRGRESRDSLTA